MRRASYAPVPTQASGEPLIVVEETGNTEDEDSTGPPSPMDGVGLDACLLSPYRDMRKRSLPTPACTSGITASQVRRLSEHGVESTGASAREAAFLATLSSTPLPAGATGGGRRHSVVTISRAPPLFGRGRRESIAAFPSTLGRVLPRRDSASGRPPATGSTTGSNFNLQLDIMDDIAEIKAARKVRLKMWRTPSRERVCEVQPLDDAGEASGTQRYETGRRHSEFVPPSPQVQQRRRASELPPQPSTSASSGIVCSNTDLISILSSLASSAQDLNRDPDETQAPSKKPSASSASTATSASASSASGTAEQKRGRLRSLRSHSFDVSMAASGASGTSGPNSWFVKRHQPKKQDKDQVVWDAGAVVNAQALGSAIEVFLARRGAETKPSWSAPTSKDDDSCESASLCSTLKDLFVK